MIYYVTESQELFEWEGVKRINAKESLEILDAWPMLQYDSETTGRDAHLCSLLLMQFGDKGENQVVVDCTTISPLLYKEQLESKYIIGQNLKFDLQFLYNYGIIPRKIYDTMIVEQLLHLGWPSAEIKYSLQDIAFRRLGRYIDKSVRGQINYMGLTEPVIRYAANDVVHLYDIMCSQLVDCVRQDCKIAAKVECDAVPSIAYMEWCGILLDETKWRKKMANDKRLLEKSRKTLDEFVTKNPQYKKYTYVNRQGDLFDGFDLTPRCTLNWDSPKQVIEFAKALGFNTTIQDKDTGDDKDSVLEKHLMAQKGVNDEFLELYFDYKEHAKVCSTYGQGHLNMINPKTGRIHTTFKQLGADSGRMSCGSQQPNTDLAKAKGIPASQCTYCNLQQLPANFETRSAFVAPKGYKFVSADFSSEESRLGADIYQDEEFLKEFRERSGDTHSMFAWTVFREKCEECGCTGVQDVAEKAEQWRKKVKSVEFAYMFGSAAHTLSQAANCSEEQAQQYIDMMNATFKGLNAFAIKGSKEVRQKGYVLMCKHTGHKIYWWDHKEWLERQKSFTPEFWEDYRANHKGTGDAIAQMVRKHFQAAGKYDRKARNSPTQGTGAVIMKDSLTSLFNWIVDNGQFGIVHICVAVHDEINCDYPEKLSDFPNILSSIMEESAAKYCKSLPIPAKAEVADYWKH